MLIDNCKIETYKTPKGGNYRPLTLHSHLKPPVIAARSRPTPETNCIRYFNKIEQSTAELLRFNHLLSSAIMKLVESGFTPRGRNSLHVYVLPICGRDLSPETKFKWRPLAAYFYFRLKFWSGGRHGTHNMHLHMHTTTRPSDVDVCATLFHWLKWVDQSR